MSSRIILAILIIAAAAAAALAQKDPVRPGWAEVSACGFTFLVPKELKEQKIAASDPCQATYTSADINIWLDFGHSDGAVIRQERMTRYSESEITVNTLPARLVTYHDTGMPRVKTSYPLVTEIYLPIMDGTNESQALAMIISTTERVGPETAKQIYRSLRYTKSQP